MTTFDSLPVALQGWQNFYILTGTASATLTGLMFVAITFGASLVTRETAQSTRAFLDPIYMHFVQVLLTSCLLVIPVLGPTLLGSVLISVGALRLVGLHAVLRRYREAQRKYNDIDMSDWLAAIVLPFLCHLLLMTAGAGFVLRQSAALIGLAIVSLALLFIGIHSAWELFVWMALAVSDRHRDPSSPVPPAARPPARTSRVSEGLLLALKGYGERAHDSTSVIAAGRRPARRGTERERCRSSRCASKSSTGPTRDVP